MQANVIASSRGVVEQDFRKDSKTPDRIWAETCYMRWWLTEGHSSGEDASFFSEESFGFVKFLEEFQRTSSEMERWKHGGARVDLTIAELPQKIKDLHSRIARLVACYLVYRNGSKKELYRAAGNFGIDLIDRVPENPLRYWIVYAVVLVASVYIGVYASAIAYDLFTGKGLSFVQDQNRTLAWIMYTLCNYRTGDFSDPPASVNGPIIANRFKSVASNHLLLDLSGRLRCGSIRLDTRGPFLWGR